MPESIAELEQRRCELVLQFAQLDDLRPGSVTAMVRRCGKPTCHCAQPDDSGHGPTLRLTYMVQGKAISETLPTTQAVRKAEHEIAEFRRYQELSRVFIEINEKICRLRPAEEAATSAQEKNGGDNPSGSRARSRSAPLYRFPGAPQDGTCRSGRCRNGRAFGNA